MTAAELIRNVLTVCGKRTVCVNRNDWHYNCDKLPHQTTTKYDIWIEPGLKSDKGEHYYGESIQELAEKVGEVIADNLMKCEQELELDLTADAKRMFAINVYNSEWTLIETYTLCDTRIAAEEVCQRDSVQLAKRGGSGNHIRIDELDGDGNYMSAGVKCKAGDKGTLLQPHPAA